MAVVPKEDAPEYIWVEIVSNLQKYFSETDFEYGAYRALLGVTQNLKLVKVSDLAASFTPPTAPPTVAQYDSGEWINILWQYALAQAWFETCEEE